MCAACILIKLVFLYAHFSLLMHVSGLAFIYFCKDTIRSRATIHIYTLITFIVMQLLCAAIKSESRTLPPHSSDIVYMYIHHHHCTRASISLNAQLGTLPISAHSYKGELDANEMPYTSHRSHPTGQVRGSLMYLLEMTTIWDLSNRNESRLQQRLVGNDCYANVRLLEVCIVRT